GAVVDRAGESVADQLHEDHDDDQQDDGDDDDLGLVAGVAAVVGQLAEPAGVHGAGHRGVADDGDRGGGDRTDEPGQRLGDQHLADHLPAARAHHPHRFDLPGGDLAQVQFEQTGGEGHRRDGQGDHRGVRAGGAAGDRGGDRDQRDDQDEEREGAQHIDHEAGDLVEAAHQRGGGVVGLVQRDAQRQAQQHGEHHGHDGHVEGDEGGLPGPALPARQQRVGEPFLQGLDHAVTSVATTPAASSS